MSTENQKDHVFYADLQVGFNMFNESYRSRVTLVPDEYVGAECVQSRIFERLLSEWRFSSTRSLSTKVHFQVHFRVASSLHARFMEMFFEDVAKKQISAFEQRCREIGSQSTGGSFARQDKQVQQRLRQAFHAACDMPAGVVDLKGLQHACAIVSDLGDCLKRASQDPLSLAAMHAAFDSNSDGRIGADEFLEGAGALLELETAHLCGGRGARSEHAFRILEDACGMELGEAKVAAIFRRKMERMEQLVPQALAMRTSSQLPRLQSGGRTDEELLASVKAAKEKAEKIVAKILPPETLSSRERFRAAVEASPGLQEAIWPEGWAGLRALSRLLEEEERKSGAERSDNALARAVA